MNSAPIGFSLFEKAKIGVVEGNCLSKPVFLYDKEKCLQILMEEDSLTEDQALEVFYNRILKFNIGEMPMFASFKQKQN